MKNLRRQENGQIAILLVMIFPVLFLLLALPLDSGIWLLDHSIAQKQVDAAALAAAQHLPDANPNWGSPASKAVRKWLEKNGSSQKDLSGCPESTPAPFENSKTGVEYFDRYPLDAPDGLYDTIQVCVRRHSPGVFSGLAGLDGVYISASAKATASPGCVVADVVLVLDNSGSIKNGGNHPALQDAATTLVDEFCLDDINGVRVGITKFGDASAPIHDMSANATSLKDAIARFEGGNDKTNIVAGLEGGGAQFSMGPGDRDAPNKIIFITDGNDTCLRVGATGCVEEESNDDAAIALASLLTGAEVYAIGVGDVAQSTVDAIATDPDGEHAFLIGDFAGLKTLVKKIAASITVGTALVE